MRSYIAAALLSTVVTQVLANDHYQGRVEAVADGDTFTMLSDGKRLRVRICGIDSPERGQPGYAKAAGALADLIEGHELACIQVGGGSVCDGRSKPINRDRIVAQCFIGKTDVAMEMIC